MKIDFEVRQALAENAQKVPKRVEIGSAAKAKSARHYRALAPTGVGTAVTFSTLFLL
jgi:hypothetical protein